MSEKIDIKMQRLSVPALRSAKSILGKIEFKPDCTLPSITPGSFTNILKPLDKIVNKTTIASAPSNPTSSINPYQPYEHRTFYSPDFDKTLYNIIYETWAIRVPASLSGAFMKAAKNENILIKLDKVRTILDDVSTVSVPYVSGSPSAKSSHKRIVLNRDFFPPETTLGSVASHLPRSVYDLLNDECNIVKQELNIHYGYFSTEQVLLSLLPADTVVPTGFSQVGHIAHVNLRHEQLPYKHVIGKVIVDKNLSVETVINKVGMIDNVYRNFKAEILYDVHDKSGDGDTKNSLVTKVKEHNLTFQFDFSEVYWNSRLHTEHLRVVELIIAMNKTYRNNNNRLRSLKNPPSTVHNSMEAYVTNKYIRDPQSRTKKIIQNLPPLILDLFAGVGPFVLPAAQKQCLVWGSDLNPRSSLYMYNNVKANKLTKNATVFNQCGRTMMLSVACRQMGQVVARVKWLESKGLTILFREYSRTKGELFTHITRTVFGVVCETSTVSEPLPEDVIMMGNKAYCVIINGLPVTTNTVKISESETIPIFYSSAYGNTLPTLLPYIADGTHTPWFHHTIMNLPASAVTFLDMYRGLYNPDHLTDLPDLPPVLNDDHARLISNTEITDVNHSSTHFNEVMKDRRGEIKSTPFPGTGYNEYELTNIAIAEKTVPHISALIVAGLRPITAHCYCFARSVSDPHGDAINMAESEIKYKLVGMNEEFNNHELVTPDSELAVNEKFTSMIQNWIGTGGMVPSDNQNKKHNQDPTLPLHYNGDWANNNIFQDGIYTHYVRNVAPLKEMMCVEVVLGPNILLDNKIGANMLTTTNSFFKKDGSLHATNVKTPQIDCRKRPSQSENVNESKKIKLT